jgi:hypothetical protein
MDQRRGIVTASSLTTMGLLATERILRRFAGPEGEMVHPCITSCDRFTVADAIRKALYSGSVLSRKMLTRKGLRSISGG